MIKTTLCSLSNASSLTLLPSSDEAGLKIQTRPEDPGIRSPKLDNSKEITSNDVRGTQLEYVSSKSP